MDRPNSTADRVVPMIRFCDAHRMKDKTRSAILFVVVSLTLGIASPAQDQPRQLRGGGHLLGETAEEFYSQGNVGDILRACGGRDWKTVSRLLRSDPHFVKGNAKEICAGVSVAKQTAVSGARVDYKGGGSVEEMRADTYTFDGGRLVKIGMVYTAPVAAFEGYHPKSFYELFAGLQEAYGPPTKMYTEPLRDAYGVQYDAHRAIWMGEADVIRISEQPGANGWTEIVAATLAEYNRETKAPKSANPLR